MNAILQTSCICSGNQYFKIVYRVQGFSLRKGNKVAYKVCSVEGLTLRRSGNKRQRTLHVMSLDHLKLSLRQIT